MTNQAITELDSATTPLDQSELIEVVQAGENKKVAISELGQNLEYVTFKVSPSVGALVTGKLYWDEDSGTMAFVTDVADVVLQVGQEQYVKARNNSGAPILNGQPVYITGGLGNRPTVDLAQADVLASSRLLGLATADIADNADGYITSFGLVRDVDTSGFSAGDDLYVSDVEAGVLINASPPTGFPAIAGSVIYSHSQNGIILVRVILSL